MSAELAVAPAPELSVLVPLVDGRGHELEAVRSWTHEQTCERGRLEVVLVSNGDSPVVESQLRGLLSAHDQLVHTQGSSQQELHCAGAQAARSPILLFAELHSLGDPGCVQHVLDRFSDGTLQAASLPSRHIAPTRVAEMEARLFEKNKWGWEGPAAWNNVMLRGFAIRRETLEQAGGLDARQGFFADIELASRLHLRGVKVEPLRDAGVRHVGQIDFAGVREAVLSRIVPECAYRLAHPPAHCDKYFGHLPQQSQAGAFRRRRAASDARRLLAMLPRAGGPAGALALLDEAWRRAPCALFGLGWLRLHYRMRLAAAWSRYQVWGFLEDRQLRAFGDVWARFGECAALDAFARADAADTVAESARYVMAELREPQLIGFHGVEQCDGRAFRWTRPVSSLRVGVRRADVEVRLECASAADGAAPRLLGLYWNDTDILPAPIQCREGGLSFPVPAASFVPGIEQLLTIVCDPIVPWRQRQADGRRRGLPLFGVQIRALAA